MSETRSAAAETEDLDLEPHQRRRLLQIFTVISLLSSIVFLADRFAAYHYITRPMLIQGTRPTVTLAQGTYVGDYNSQNHSYPQIIEYFLGVSYALDTGGENRFRPPRPVNASNAIFQANKWGDRCPNGLGRPEVNVSENCLNLNIFRPRHQRAEQGEKHRKMPVMVYIHGGSFNMGTASMWDMGTFVAWSAEPMLGVTINYRLGALGFLPSEMLAAEEGLNLGLRDQRAALEWVKENIAAFGGDPNNVTLAGFSAGAHSVGHHFLDTSGPRLFHRAILESGAPTSRAVLPYDSDLYREQLDHFLGQLHIPSSFPPYTIMAHLRALPWQKIHEASVSTFYHYNAEVRWPFQPCIAPSSHNSSIITDAPIAKWMRGDWNKMPVLTGYNTNEGAMFVPARAWSSIAFNSFFRTLIPQLSPSDMDALNELFPDPVVHEDSPYAKLPNRAGLGLQFSRLEAAYSQYAYIAPVRQTAKFISEDTEDPSPVYLYHFDVEAGTSRGGVDHGAHDAYTYYDEGIRSISETQHAITGHFHSYLTSFVLTGDPNAVRKRFGQRPPWEKFEPNGMFVMVIGGGNKEREVMATTPGFDDLSKEEQQGLLSQVRGTVAMMWRDGWRRKETEFWWERTGLSEGVVDSKARL